jgi:predicted metal-binding membrane protein
MWTAKSDTRLFALVTLLIVALAWLALVVWGRSPYESYLDHRQFGELGIDLSGAYLTRASIFVAGWSLMTVAMMLPTSLPLLLLFRTITRSRPNRDQLMGLLVAGYLLIWVAFGALAHLGDIGLHEGVNAWHWLEHRAWVLAALPLLIAGVYQFTPLKYLCLDKCRSPYSFVIGHWHGSSPRMEAFRLGVSHGLFCVGCCWSLMLLMFAVSLGNVAWMLVLAAFMALEKNVSWGRQLSIPLGVVLLAAGATVLALGSAGSVCAC